MEPCQSGLTYLFAKEAGSKIPREFESRRLRNKTKSGFPPKNASAQSADDWAEFPPNPIPAKIFHAPRGSLVTNTNL